MPVKTSSSTTKKHEINLSFAFTATPETTDWIELEVSGKIPDWINGHLYRVGPGSFQQPLDKTQSQNWNLKHWFDGLSMLHEFRIDTNSGRVLYRSKDLSQPFQQKAIEQKGFISFGPKDPCKAMFAKVSTMFHQVSALVSNNMDLAAVACNANVSVIRDFSKKADMVVATDATFIQSVDPETLQPQRMLTFTDVSEDLNGILSCAHALLDPRTNELFNYIISFNYLTGGTKLTVFSIKKGETGDIVKTLHPVETPKASYIHSFSVTSDYVIIVAYPAHHDLYRLIYHQTLMDSVIFDPSKPTSIFVIPRNGTEPPMEYHDLPSFFSFHHVNSFQSIDQETGSIIIDVDMSTYKDMKIVDQLLIENIVNPDSQNMIAPAYQRLTLTIDPHGKVIRKATLNDMVDKLSGDVISLELPKVRYEGMDKPTRFVYGICHHENRFSSGLVKVDVKLGSQTRWFLPDHYPGEPIFVENPNGTNEDDGAILSVVLDAGSKTSFLLVLDATTFKEIGRAQLRTGNFVIPGFHGLFHSSN